jgi:hypothetical protein
MFEDQSNKEEEIAAFKKMTDRIVWNNRDIGRSYTNTLFFNCTLQHNFKN